MSIFQEDISEKTWDIKYRYRLRDQIIDQTIEDTWHRVATAVAKAESLPNRAQWTQAFYDILASFRFLPGGRILAGAGTDHEVTLFNCFVMSVSEDTLPAVFDALREAAITLQYGGGVGYDFSILRPRDYPVTHTGKTASGPISFMRIWDAMCATMESTGARRGAMMGILRCDHPDIEAFIDAKANPHELRHFNLSVLVTDAFMQAVQEDRDWELVFPVGEKNYADTMLRHWSGSAEPVACRVVKRVRAKQLWEKIIRGAYDYAEPGVLFEDCINRHNNLWYREWISATNPCGEIPLPLYGCCNLGSLNLTQFVKRPYSKEAELDWDALQKTTIVATRFLDNVIDVTHYPLMVQKQEERLTRRMGLGVTGLADMLVMLGMAYGSEDSFVFTERLIKTITETTWQASIELARERGVFPALNAGKYIQGHFVEKLPSDIRQAIEKHGIRNSHHNTIAPTGTTSLLANNISSGIEPIYHGKYLRKMRTTGDTYAQFSVTDYALRVWQQQDHAEPFPPAWQDINTLTPEQHLKMQATVQPYIDNSISKTINVPVDFPFEKLISVYSDAWKMNLKGCTVFRSNPVTGSILSENEVENCGHCG